MIDVLVVGAGPAGLSTSAALAQCGARVRVLDRDEASGGVPRHSDHPGYGWRETRVLSGPAYARRLTDRASEAGAQIDVRATVTDLRPLPGGGAEADITAPWGRETVVARAVVLATGCRERPRSARLVPGARPSGILTTGWLQRLVHLDHRSPGTRAVVVGAEHVSYSAVVTLAEAGCRTIAMVTDDDRHVSFSAFDVAARTRYRFPLLTRTHILEIHGRERVTGVTIEHEDGRRGHLECDTVVFTGNWYPENDLAVRAGIDRDPRTHAPLVDTRARTRTAGIFAVGNLIHPASTADACAQDGARVEGIISWLGGSPWPESWAAIDVDSPLLWSSPGLLVPGEAGPLRLQTARGLNAPLLLSEQEGRTLWQGRLAYIRPTRPFALPAEALAGASGPVRIRVARSGAVMG